MAAALDPLIDTWLVAGHSRAARRLPPGSWRKCCKTGGARRDIQTPFRCIGEALSYAYNAAGENDRIAAFGSFYTVAEAMACAEDLNVTLQETTLRGSPKHGKTADRR